MTEKEPKWTTEEPTEEGWYWAVTREDGHLNLQLITTKVGARRAEGEMIADRGISYPIPQEGQTLWFGPVKNEVTPCSSEELEGES